MRLTRTTLINFFLVFFVGATAVFADGTQLGEISGRVVDPTGAALPGVTVEVMNIEKGSTRTTVTDAQGQYNVRLLQPGPYQVTISLQGFETFVAKNAIVEVEKRTTVDAKLRVVGTSETMTVQGDVPIVDKTNASQTTTMQSALAQTLPVGRSFQALALTVPGVVLPGNANANANFHGALSTDNLYLFDGIDTTDPTTGGFGQNFTYEAIQEVSVTTSAASADYGRAVGGIINVVTKTGTNAPQGSYKEVLTNDKWNAQNRGVSPTSGASFARVKFDSLVRVHSATLGGPIWRDHAWFFGAFEWDKTVSPQRQTLDPKAPQNFVSTPRDHFYDVKGSWQVAPSHLLVLKANAAPTDNIAIDRHNGGINAIPRFAGDLGAMNIQDQASTSHALQYSGVPSSQIALEGGLASSKIHINFKPFVDDTPVHQDTSTGLFYNGPAIVGFLERTRSQGDFSANYYRTIGSQTHDLKAGIDTQDLRSTVNQRFGANQLFVDKSFNLSAGTSVPSQRRDYDPPVASSSRGRNTALYALDKFGAGNHLSLNLGVRAEKQTGTSDVGRRIVDTTTVSPRLSGTYDVHADNKTLLVASYGRFVQNILQQFDDQFAALPPKSSFEVFNWDAKANQWVDAGHQRLGGALVGVDNLRPTNVDEFTAGVEQQFGRNVGLTIRAIHRKWNDIIDDVVSLTSTGTLSKTFTNLPGTNRSYNALETVFSKRFSSDWGAQVSYTYSRSKGNQFGTISSDLANFASQNCKSSIDSTIGQNGIIDCGVAGSLNRQGFAPYDRTNVVRAYTAYHLPIHGLDVNLSPAFTLQSGDTFQKQGTLTVLNSAGVSTGNTLTYYYTPAGSNRLPTIYQVDFATEATYPIHGLAVGLKGEIFNVTDQQKQIQASTFGWCDDASSTNAQCRAARSSFGLGTSRNAYQTPRAYRLTALFRF